MGQFEVQTVKFNDLECRASISLTSVSCDGQCKADHRRRALLAELRDLAPAVYCIPVCLV